MKRLILFELIVLFLATTFESDSPPGWYLQVLPVSDQINDIFFLDSLTGWVVTDGRTSTNDTGYIMKTLNGGENWTVQYNQPMKLNAVQFLDANTGYTVGGSGSGTGRIFKTTNSGNNWININSFAGSFTDISFVNNDTGWICDDNPLDGGIFKTMNGGANWQSQLGAGFSIKKLFFISKDTGWAGSNEADGKLYRTTNGGQVWNLQYTTSIAVGSIFFLDNQKGWIRAGGGNGVAYTTNSGVNWTVSEGDFAGVDLRFVNDSVGYSGGLDSKVRKSYNGGKNWGYQTSPIFNNQSVSMIKADTVHGWAGGNGLIHTTDGGGNITFTGITPISSEVPAGYELLQNYPNPFNSMTKLKFQISKQGYAVIKVYDIAGKEISLIVNENLNTGVYEIIFNANALASGVYFYTLIVDGTVIDTKRMILLK